MQDFRPTLLHHALELAPFEGWSDYTLREAARLAGVTDEEARRAFGGGIQQCLRYYFEQLDEQLQKQWPSEKLAGMRVPQRIETLLIARFEAMLPHREALKRAACLRLLPWNTPEATRSLFSMTDWMWRSAGDQSTDYNYYTKRLTLAGVYVSTFLCWLGDPTPDLVITRQFLKAQLSRVAEFGKFKKNLFSKLKAFSY